MNPAAIQKSYRFYAPFYDFVFGKVMDPGRKKVIEKIKQNEGMQILDVGVGTGLSIPYYEPFVTVTGIDISKEMLDKARNAYPSGRYSCVGAFLEMDAQNLKFSNDFFDAAVVEYVASVVPDPQKMMKEVSRVCQPGADIFVLNHFASEKGFFRMVESVLAPLSQRLGFRTNLSLPMFLDMSSLQLVEILPVNLGGYWKLLHFRNSPATSEKTDS
ncbi:MAG: methyltransferase domain-containing protein [Opitutales bacterium]